MAAAAMSLGDGIARRFARGFCRTCTAGPYRVPVGVVGPVHCPNCRADLAGDGLREESALAERIALGTPLRITELSRLTGYSREQIRQWIDAGTIRTVRAPTPTGRRRIPTDEAERIGRALRLL
jgi:hypothetical protein